MITNSATNCSLLAVSLRKFLFFFFFFKDNVIQIYNDLLNREKDIFIRQEVTKSLYC